MSGQRSLSIDEVVSMLDDTKRRLQATADSSEQPEKKRKTEGRVKEVECGQVEMPVLPFWAFVVDVARRDGQNATELTEEQLSAYKEEWIQTLPSEITEYTTVSTDSREKFAKDIRVAVEVFLGDDVITDGCKTLCLKFDLVNTRP